LLLKLNREKEEDSATENPPEEEELDEDETSDEENGDPLPAVSPYEVLMQSFQFEKPRQAKRRKIEHCTEPGDFETKGDNELEIVDADAVEEIEEGQETTTDGLLEEDDEPEDDSDPFEIHFADPDDNLLSIRLKAIQENQWTIQEIGLPNIGKTIIRLPQVSDGEIAAVPTISGPEGLKLKQKLASVVARQRPSFDVLEGSIAPMIYNYQDVLFCERSLSNQESLRRLTCLHAVNHVFK